jgi:hypothetical protein
MDNFSEQLVKRQPTSSDSIKKVLIYGGGILLTVILLVVSFVTMGSIISMFGFVLAAAAGYGTYFLGQSTYVEYEYTFTNGELDIDKIIAKKKRRPLISAETRKFTAFGRYDENIPETSDMTIIFASDNVAAHEYYADFESETYGKARLVFAPDEVMLENIKRALPRNLRNVL